MPWLQRLPQLQLDVANRECARSLEPELEMRSEPLQVHGQLGARQIRDNVFEIGPNEVRRHKTVMGTMNFDNPGHGA